MQRLAWPVRGASPHVIVVIVVVAAIDLSSLLDGDLLAVFVEVVVVASLLAGACVMHTIPAVVGL